MESDRVKSTLRDMDKTSTWYHDDLFGEFAGYRYYAQKRYAEALHYFEIGAYYADKPSQISIGLMYLKGEGVPADTVQALAWMDLAAERGYPAYVATRDRVAATLSAEELSRVATLREYLASIWRRSRETTARQRTTRRPTPNDRLTCWLRQWSEVSAARCAGSFR
jgi:TPR repeat protein